jgi:hypothetical protein
VELSVLGVQEFVLQDNFHRDIIQKLVLMEDLFVEEEMRLDEYHLLCLSNTKKIIFL